MDYGLLILAGDTENTGGKARAKANDAYNFEKGDFTITVLFQTKQPGTVVMCQRSHSNVPDIIVDEYPNAGWYLDLESNGVISFVTFNGFGSQTTKSVNTAALDGAWHSVAVVRSNGQIQLWFDGVQSSLASQASGETHNISSFNGAIIIGSYGESGQPYSSQFVGTIEDVTLWNRALTSDDIWKTMFNKVDSQSRGLVGYWPFDQNFNDVSPTANHATAHGPVSFIPIFHCKWAVAKNAYSYLAINGYDAIADNDYGAKFGDGGLITIPGHSAYRVGKGDFTLTLIFATTVSGPLISLGSLGGELIEFGIVLGVEAEGRFSLSIAARYDSEFFKANPTTALDGRFHHVAMTKIGDTFTIFFDGQRLFSYTASLKDLTVTQSQILIGSVWGPKRQNLLVEDVTFWNRALSVEEIQPTRYNLTELSANGLIGYWKMDQSFADASPIRNDGSSSGDVTFVRVFHDAQRRQTLKVNSGAGFLYGVIIDQSKSTAVFPEGALLEVYKPDGTKLEGESNTEDLFVHMKGQSIWAFAVKNPSVGTWTFVVTGPRNIPLLFSAQTTPQQDVSQTINDALKPLYEKSNTSRVARDIGMDTEEQENFGFDDVGKWAGVTLMTLGAIATSTVVVGGAALAAPVVFGAAAALGLGSVFLGISLTEQLPSGSDQLSNGMGVQTGTDSGGGEQPLVIGGQSTGSTRLILDGRDYFTLMRNLLLAVQYNQYVAQGITVPTKPTFENLIKGISQAGRNAYVLMWDTSVLLHMAENNDALKYYLRLATKGEDARRNARTATALSGLSGVFPALESYTSYTGLVSTAAQHQKISIFSVGGAKYALVGGLNLVTPHYWDDPDHPMYADDNGARNFHTWHDTAVLVKGPIVDLVEAEFDRRWKLAKPSVPVQKTGTYAKVACWQINHDSVLDEARTLDGTPSRIPYSNPDFPSADIRLDFLVTNSQYRTPITQIRSQLLARINEATKYIYIENFTFHDIYVVKAISAKIKSSASDFRCIILLPYPAKVNDDVNQSGQFFLSKMAFLCIILENQQWTQLTLKDKTIVKREDCSSSLLTYSDSNNRGVEFAVFSWTLKSNNTTRSVAISEIVDLTQTSDSKLVLTSPVRYFKTLNPNNDTDQLPGLASTFRRIHIHSKLAIIDDRYALVGSANFNRRSLEQDGECSVGVFDPTVVKKFRQDLFSHWGVSGENWDWTNIMTGFAQNPSEGVGPVPLRIDALSTQMPGWWWNYLTALSDGSDFM